MVAILEAKQLTERALLSIPGVTGVGIGASSPTRYIHIYVEEVTAEIEAEIPKVIAGYPVKIIKSGRFKALSLMEPKLKATAEPIRTSRIRPAMGGVSIGTPEITAGTFGGVIGGLILSNNHVLANVSTFEHPKVNIGHPIIQPGAFDNGVMPNDQIATLHSYVALSEKTPNLVDAAWAKPLNPAEVSEEILGIGYIAGMVQPQVDMQVQKSGRTTGVTTGKIIDVNATTTVDYDGLQLPFTDQVITEHMMDGGDSGSLGLDMNKNLWGLGFAGSDELTVFNKISNIAAIPAPTFVVEPRDIVAFLIIAAFLKSRLG